MMERPMLQFYYYRVCPDLSGYGFNLIICKADRTVPGS